MYIGKYRAEKLKAELTDEVLYFCDSYLGKGLYDREMLEEIIICEHHYFYAIYDNEKMIGVFYFYADRAKKVKMQLTEKVGNISKDTDWVGVCRSIVLHEDYRHLGISGQLLSHFSHFLEEREGVSIIYILAWIYNEKIRAANHLEQCGYTYIEQIKEPWSGVEGLMCPMCGEKRCRCDGILYGKYLQVKEN